MLLSSVFVYVELTLFFPSPDISSPAADPSPATIRFSSGTVSVCHVAVSVAEMVESRMKLVMPMLIHQIRMVIYWFGFTHQYGFILFRHATGLLFTRLAKNTTHFYKLAIQ